MIVANARELTGAATLDLPARAVVKQPTPAYYDVTRKGYWIQNERLNWISIDESALKRHWRRDGLSTRVPEETGVSPLENQLLDTQIQRDVDYAGPLAGYGTGFIEQYGHRILVTHAFKRIQPRAGAWPLIGKILEGLFLDTQCDQRPYVYGWLKTGLESLRHGTIRPGQVLAIAGEHACGKSLLQNLITEILGGRSAKPFRYMTGATQFNSDLFMAEHLMIEDEAASTDLRTRKQFGAKIKDFTVNEVQSCHGKNRVALSLKPFWRVTITLNDEAENLMILPPIEESLKDKIILLRANKAEIPMDTSQRTGRERFWAALLAELPAFVQFLLDYTIPPELASPRFGVTHYHHPELLEAIDGMSPETKLLAIIDTELFRVGQSTWTGTAEQLERALCQSELGFEARKLLSWSKATGVYLGRLANRHPERFEFKRTTTMRLWTIRPGS